MNICCPRFTLFFSLQNLLFSFCTFRDKCLEAIFHETVALLHLLHSKTLTALFLQSIISRMFYHECPWNMGYNVPMGFPPCIPNVLYHKNNILLWSKGQACLLPIIKYFGTSKLRVPLLWHHTLCVQEPSNTLCITLWKMWNTETEKICSFCYR